jgi:hypothetical protein
MPSEIRAFELLYRCTAYLLCAFRPSLFCVFRFVCPIGFLVIPKACLRPNARFVAGVESGRSVWRRRSLKLYLPPSIDRSLGSASANTSHAIDRTYRCRPPASLEGGCLYGIYIGGVMYTTW